MNSPHRPDERETWYAAESFPGFTTADHRQATTPDQGATPSWTSEADPLTGPLAADQVPDTPEPYPPDASRQHAERVPRYSSPAGSPRPSGDQLVEPQGSLLDAGTRGLPTMPRPTSGHPGAAPTSGHPGATQGHPGAAPTSGHPGAAQMPGRPVGARAEPDAGIPPSLAPMLSNEEQAYVQHTERINVPTGYQSAGPPPGGYPQPSAPPPQPRSGNRSAAAATVLATLLAVVPPLLLLYQGLFGGEVVSASGVVAGTLMLIGLPMLAAGVYPLLSGASPAEGGIRGVLRPPFGYLLVGLVLLLAAGLAAG